MCDYPDRQEASSSVVIDRGRKKEYSGLRERAPWQSRCTGWEAEQPLTSALVRCRAAAHSKSSASTKTGCPYLEEGVLQGLQCCWPLGWVPLAAPGYKIECLRRGLRHLQAHAALSLYS